MSNDFLDQLGGGLQDVASGAGNVLGNLFGGTGGSGPAPMTTGATPASPTIDPSIAATVASNAGQPAPTQNPPQNPQGQQGQTSQTAAPPSAIDQLKQALLALRQRERQNPWQTGGGGQAYINRAAGQNSPMLNRASGIPTGAVPPAAPNPADLPAPGATPTEGYDYEGESNQSEYGYDIPGGAQRRYPYSYEGESNQPEYGPGTNPRQYPYPAEGESSQPEYGPGRVQQALPDPSGPTGAGQVTTRGGTLPAPAGGAGSTPFEPQPLPGLGKVFGGGLLGRLLPLIMNVTPAETGELKPGQVPSTGDEFPPPEAAKDIPASTGDEFPPASAAVTKAPETGKPIKTVDPKTNKPVDPKTGQKLPAKKGPQPTTTGHYRPTPGNARQPQWVPGGPPPGIMHDMLGGGGIPPMLGQLAQMALPLLLQGLIGGFGGGGRGRFGGFGRERGYPFFHPSFGWRMHGHHPGGGWRPMDPNYFRRIMAGGLGGGAPGFGGTGGGPLGYAGDGGGGASYDPYYDKSSRYQNPGQPSANVIGKGPDGQALPYTGQQVADFTDQVAQGLDMDPQTARRVLAGESSYGQNYTNNREIDGIPSYGPFQLHDSGPGSVGYAFKQATGEDPRDPSTWKDQIVFALNWARKNGWGPWGAATKAGIPQWAGINRRSNKQFAWNYGQPGGGVTATGGSTDPNPDGGKPLRLQPIPDTATASSAPYPP